MFGLWKKKSFPREKKKKKIQKIQKIQNKIKWKDPPHQFYVRVRLQKDNLSN
jgi:hypothetical protein